MHYRAVIKGSDLNKVNIQTTLDGMNGKISFTDEDDIEQRFNFKVLGKRLVKILQECYDDECTSYLDNKQYEFKTLPYLVVVLCAKMDFSHIEIGLSKHSISIYDRDVPGRFIPIVENQTLILHESEGVVFRREEEFYIALHDEFVADMLISNLGHSLRFFNDKYLVRFNHYGKFFYFPLGAVFGNETLRDLEYSNLPEYKHFDWEAKLAELEEFPEKVTRPKL